VVVLFSFPTLCTIDVWATLHGPGVRVARQEGLKAIAMQEAKKLLEEKFKTGKNRWFFTKLRF